MVDLNTYVEEVEIEEGPPPKKVGMATSVFITATAAATVASDAVWYYPYSTGSAS